MSDPEDRFPSNSRRGSMPRTNRPRPTHARRPGERAAGDAASAASPAVAEPSPDQETKSAVDAVTGGTTTDTLPPTRREPKDSVTIEKTATYRETPEEIATRATAKMEMEGPDYSTRRLVGGGLKQAALVRSGGDRSDSPLSINAYVGCTIDGRYRIESVLGRGGMGVVYRARHEVIDKLVAIKILLPTEDMDVVARFVTEARAATSIGNPHIVDTIDFGRLPDDSTYFAMEYLEGKTLADIIRSSGFLPVSRAVHIAKQIAEGMSAAHAANIVHRDLKPENVFVTQRGKEPDFVKLLDFGIAKVASVQNRITRAGTIFGTPQYMSPEQAAGTEVDHRSDIYSLGVMLYEMVSGKTPFEAENAMGLLTQHMYTQPKPLTEVKSPPQPIPVQIDAIALKCLSKRPEARYATMRELTEDLERFEQGKNPTAFADLLARKDDEALASVRAAVQSASRGKRRGARAFFVTLFIVLIAGGVWGLARSPLPEKVMRSVGPAEPTELGEIDEEGIPVALVFSPIDAEVFRGDDSLGGMPVQIKVPHGEVVDVTIKRDGFRDEPVRLDGSKRVIVVRMTALEGVTPTIPVPDDAPLEALKEKLGFEEAAAAMLARPDGGAPKRSRAGHAPDAGARPTAAKVKAEPAPSPPPASTEAPSPPKPKAEPAPAPSAQPPETPSIEGTPRAPKGEAPPESPAAPTPQNVPGLEPLDLSAE